MKKNVTFLIIVAVVIGILYAAYKSYNAYEGAISFIDSVKNAVKDTIKTFWTIINPFNWLRIVAAVFTFLYQKVTGNKDASTNLYTSWGNTIYGSSSPTGSTSTNLFEYNL